VPLEKVPYNAMNWLFNSVTGRSPRWQATLF